jgi:nucleotide-binding universal stress UspA family protein
MKNQISAATNARPCKACRLAKKTDNGLAPLAWNTILAPTDLSNPSKCAIKTAVAVAQKCGAKLILLHVVQCPNCASFDAPPAVNDMIGQARESLDDIARTISPEVEIEKLVRFGTREPVEQIIEEASRVSADLIIIATHGYSGLKRVLLGSTAERVVRHAPCPVLVVRRSSNGSPQTAPRLESANPFRTD